MYNKDLFSVLEKISVACHMKELLKFLLCHWYELIKIDVRFWRIICHFMVLRRRFQFSSFIIWFCTSEERKEIAYKQTTVTSKTFKAFKSLIHFEQDSSDWPCKFKRKWAISTKKAQFFNQNSSTALFLVQCRLWAKFRDLPVAEAKLLLLRTSIPQHDCLLSRMYNKWSLYFFFLDPLCPIQGLKNNMR